MPVYLVHGFRWPRDNIRIWVILNNVDEAAPNYIMNNKSPAALKESFVKKYPQIMERLPSIHFVEQYNPQDLRPEPQPYAFVADTVFKTNLGINVSAATDETEIVKEEWIALAELKDELIKVEPRVGAIGEIGWFVVYNGDPELKGKKTKDEIFRDGVARLKAAFMRRVKPGLLKRLLTSEAIKSVASQSFAAPNDSTNTQAARNS